MTTKPIYLAILWHMHQPYYRDVISRKCFFPWVRLHGIKDYYDMPAILESYPNVKQNFNLVPSLIEQIELYTEQGETDIFLELSRKPAAELTPEDKEFLLLNFFFANWQTMVDPYPRYQELLNRRGRYLGKEEVKSVIRYFSKQDYLDLQVWFNLVWFDPLHRQRDPALAELIKKSRRFSEEDKQFVLTKQLQILREIMPLYQRMQDTGQIEVSVSPYYHPILPLLCDTEIAKHCQPNIKLPEIRFIHPEDAEAQIVSALQFYQERFGCSSAGLWPSEGSVSDAVISLAAKHGFRWLATDEGILQRSFGDGLSPVDSAVGKKGILRPADLYRPYLVGETKERPLAIVFRDRTLSDLIGFQYFKMTPKEAVTDFIARLERIANQVANEPEPRLVTVILDGENAWEYYPNDGHDFLELLYQQLNDHPRIRCTTINEFISQHPPVHRLHKIHPGSWIDSNFAIWIGSEEDNAAWEMLAEARQVYAAANPNEIGTENLALAWKSLLIAEGSDWNWWYGTEHSSSLDEQFDQLYRTHIGNIYTALGRDIPPQVAVPIKRVQEQLFSLPVGLTKPKLDGKVTDYYEWLNAGKYEVSRSGGTMEPAHSIVKTIYCGFDLSNVYLRIDTNLALCSAEFSEITTLIYFFKPKRKMLELTVRRTNEHCEATVWEYIPNNGGWNPQKKLTSVAVNKIIELGIPFTDLDASPSDIVQLQVLIKHGEINIQRCPANGVIQFTVPAENYEELMWSV
ncbi:MAG: glycoside hydrolase family 57 protein [bacterium]|nr:glycoside hydrolase family 57 protein [bacterium]